MAGPKPDCGAQSLAEAAAAWLPTSDPVAAARILAILQQIATSGADPIAELREATGRWFGPRVAVAMPVPTRGTPVATDARLVFETLPTHREPTLWPQRPKRLPDELFSSWLWRSAVAAGTPPRKFASQALGGPCEDPDRDVRLTVLRRLAQRTGQTSAHLAGGLLQVSATATYDTPSSLAENVLLLEDTFLLARAGCDRLGQANAVLQYCPLCFRRTRGPIFVAPGGWRTWLFACSTVVACGTAAGSATSRWRPFRNVRQVQARAAPDAWRRCETRHLVPAACARDRPRCSKCSFLLRPRCRQAIAGSM
jgi:hypothetical protein